MRGRQGSTLVATAIIFGCAANARAQSAAPQAAPPPPPVTLPAPETLQWPTNYATAKQALLDGEWDKAASALDELVKTAPSPEDARAARELAELARYWQKRDLAFVQRQSLGESSLSSKAVDRRTTDEIVTLYTTMAAYGAGLGLSLAVIATPTGGTTSAAAFIIPAIIGTGAGIGGVALADTFGRFRYGQPQAIASGTFLGLGEALLFDFWHVSHQSNTFGATWDAKAYVGIGVATTTLGAALGGVFGAVLPMTPGRASWVSSMGLWSGGLVACVTGAIIGAANSNTPDNNGDNVVLSALIGYNAGIAGGIFTAGPVSPSISRVRLLDLGGLVGGLTMFGIYAAVATSTRQNKDMDGYAALGFTGLGIAAGLTTSWLLTRSMAPDKPNVVDEGHRPAASRIDLHPMLYPTQGGASAALAGTW